MIPSLIQRLNHVYLSQSKELYQEHLKYVATALRAESTLREHIPQIRNTHNEMNQMLENVKRYEIA